MNHDFENIEVKENALELLELSLRKKRQKCMIGTGSMSDPYMPLEKELCFTRKALEQIEKYKFGAALITKSDLVLRDLDLLKKINENSKCVVQMTLTTADDEICKKIEPGVCPTSRRFEVLKILHENNIPTVVWLCPILPFINDTKENIAALLKMCREAHVYGIICFGMGLTLRQGSREYFYACLDRLFPGLKEKYIQMYGSQYIIGSFRNDELMHFFHSKCEEYHIVHNNQQIFAYLSQFEHKEHFMQGSLF